MMYTEADLALFQTFERSIDFLQWLKARAESQTRLGKLTLAELAKRGGFKSRAFVGSVFTGKRNLTEESVEAFAEMLRMNNSEKAFLSALTRFEKGILNSDKALARIKRKYSNKLIRKTIKIETKDEKDNYPLTGQTFQAYAALSSINVPRTLTEAAKIAGLSEQTCLREFTALIQRGCVTEQEGKYYSNENHLMIDQSDSTTWLQECFLEDTALIQEQAKNNFKSTEKLFVTYNFGVSKEQLPLLVKTLREVLNGWVEENVEKVPEQVVALTVAMI